MSHDLCGTCKGAGSLVVDGQVVDCKACKGTGICQACAATKRELQGATGGKR